MAHPDKDSGTEEEDWFVENFVKTAKWRGQRSLATWVTLRPLNSYSRSKLTFEVIWRSPWLNKISVRGNMHMDKKKVIYVAD